jgi:hypothetical protein
MNDVSKTFHSYSEINQYVLNRIDYSYKAWTQKLTLAMYTVK